MPAMVSSLLLAVLSMSGWPWHLFHRQPRPEPHLDWARSYLQEFAVAATNSKKGTSRPRAWSQFAEDFVWLDRASTLDAIGRGRRPELLMMIGHAECLAGNTPAAVFAYRRGLRVAPTHQRLRESIQYARSRIEYPPGYGNALPTGSWLSARLVSDALYCLTGIAYVAACLLGAFWLATLRKSLARRSAICLGLALITGLLSFLTAERVQYHEQIRIAVITEDGVTLRQGNAPSYRPNVDIPVLNGGVEARVIHVRGGWVQIQLPTGQIGWVPREKVLVG